MSEADAQHADTQPVFSVVRGHPTDEELVALLAVLSSQGSTGSEGQRPAVSGWSAYWRAARAPLMPGPGAWRASSRV